FLGVLAVAGDAAGQTIGTLAVRAHQTLRGHGLVSPERLQEITIAVYAGREDGSIDVPFEHLKVHLMSSPLSVNVGSITAKTTVRGRTLLPDVSRVGIHPTFVGYASAGGRRGWADFSTSVLCGERVPRGRRAGDCWRVYRLHRQGELKGRARARIRWSAGPDSVSVDEPAAQSQCR